MRRRLLGAKQGSGISVEWRWDDEQETRTTHGVIESVVPGTGYKVRYINFRPQEKFPMPPTDEHVLVFDVVLKYDSVHTLPPHGQVTRPIEYAPQYVIYSDGSCDTQTGDSSAAIVVRRRRPFWEVQRDRVDKLLDQHDEVHACHYPLSTVMAVELAGLGAMFRFVRKHPPNEGQFVLGIVDSQAAFDMVIGASKLTSRKGGHLKDVLAEIRCDYAPTMSSHTKSS